MRLSIIIGMMLFLFASHSFADASRALGEIEEVKAEMDDLYWQLDQVDNDFLVKTALVALRRNAERIVHIIDDGIMSGRVQPYKSDAISKTRMLITSVQRAHEFADRPPVGVASGRLFVRWERKLKVTLDELYNW